MKPPANASIENRADSLAMTPRSAEAEPQLDAVGGGFLPRRLDSRAYPGEDRRHAKADCRIRDEDHAIGSYIAKPHGKHGLRREPSSQCPDRGRDVAHEVVPGVDRCQAAIRGPLAEGSLLDGEERPDLVAGRADDPDRRGDDEERHGARQRERDAGHDHQQGPGDEHTPTSESICACRQPE
jgi:hypothetical protein